jgi:threonine/homoserine/homoserine lactone efflux protein
LILIPGPAVALIVANALAHGSRGALVSVAGVSTAVVGQLLLVGFGMASAMALLAEWLEWLRWAGVAYLVYLGIRQWRAAPVALGDLRVPTVSRARLYWTGVVVNATNPKTLVFYAAFFPQFVDPTAAVGPQIALLCVTFLVVGRAAAALAGEPGPGAAAQPGHRRAADGRGFGIGAGAAELEVWGPLSKAQLSSLGINTPNSVTL